MFHQGLQDRFPDLDQRSNQPAMFTLNGCGLTLWGSRDHDQETRSYVTTHCLCLIFLPVLCIGSYRVVDSPVGGWYILGKVPMSNLAKAWNLSAIAAVLLAILGVNVNNYLTSPAYLAGKRLAEADQLAANGEFARAAMIYQDVAFESPVHKQAALENLDALFSDDQLNKKPAELLEVTRTAVNLSTHFEWPGGNAALKNRLLGGISQVSAAEPKVALQIGEVGRSFLGDDNGWKTTRLELLQKLVALEPQNPELVSQLAVEFESQEKLDECEKLLTPLAKQLGDLDGARILGQILVRQDKQDAAYELLLPYTTQRLEKLHAAEKSFTEALSTVHDQTLDQLRSNRAPGFNMVAYGRASEAQQQDMVDNYINERLKSNPTVKAAREALGSAAEVVPAALDMGMLHLRRAQDTEDASARKTELERAEKTFLAIGGVAGDDDRYRMQLGQVYYWLGKHDEGHKLFEELLTSQQRSYAILMAVAPFLRLVGEDAEARKLSEEAYAAASSDDEKHRAARFRTVVHQDVDDEIAWLNKSDPRDPQVQASLAEARSTKALANGDKAEAERQTREAIAVYSKLVENATTLNNSVTSYLTLYRITGDKAAFDQAVTLMDKAIALNPSDSILLGNAAYTLLISSLTQVIGDRIDLSLLKQAPNWDACTFIYDDKASREAFRDQLRANPVLARSRSYQQKVVLVSPKSPRGWAMLTSTYSQLEDLPSLRSLDKQVQTIDFDQTESLQNTLDTISGKDDAKDKSELLAELAENETILTEARKNGGATFAYAASLVIDDRRQLATLGEAIDYDATVQLAEEAYAAAPSKGSRYALVRALLSRACQAMSSDAKFAELLEKCRRSLSPESVICWSISCGEAPQNASANADVQRAMQLRLEAFKLDPDGRGTWDWAFLHHDHPEVAEAIVNVVNADEDSKLLSSISQRCNPYLASTALDEYWRGEIDGKPQSGAAHFKKLVDAGIPMPDLKE